MAAKKTPEKFRAELHDQIEALAREVVLVEVDEWDGPDGKSGAGAFTEALRQIARQAGKAGFPKVEKLAAELMTSIGETSKPAALTAGIQRLQETLGPPGPAVAPPPAAAGEDPEAVETNTLSALGQDPELLTDFILESREHLSNIENRLLELEQNPACQDSLHAAFREFHSIKGLAGFLDLSRIHDVAHELETVLDRARNGQLAITPEVIDVVLSGADYLRVATNGIEAGLQGKPPPELADHHELIERVVAVVVPAREAAAGSPAGPAEVAANEGEEKPPGPGEPVTAAPPPATPPERTQAEPSSRQTKAPPPVKDTQAVKVGTNKLDYLVDMVGELVVAQSLLRHDPDLARVEGTQLQRNLSQLSRITTDVQRTAMSMRMVPVSNLFRRLARLVRDLSRKEGKRVELVTAGDDTELDRNIVEELADPLMHMVRNAVDHGLESAAERKAAGKPATGRIRLSAYHQSGFIVIELADDGRGLSREKILKRALERGLVADGAGLSDGEVQNLIFEPGFSTATVVNDVSGRGVGMDVVKRNITKLRGRVDIRSVEGQGTTFTLKMPLTLAIIEGLIVGVGNERYVVPIYAVREMLRPTAEAMSTLHNRDEMVMVRGRLLPVVRLYRKFGVTPRSEDPTACLLLVTENLGRQFCLMVDNLIGKQEVVIKSLGEMFKNIAGISGGAILGDGHVGLILDMDTIFGANAHA